MASPKTLNTPRKADVGLSKKEQKNDIAENWSSANKIQIKPAPGADITKVIFAQFKWVTPESETP